MTATYTGTEDADDAWEERETRLRLGPHHDGGTGQVEGHDWPSWALSSREQRDLAFLEQEAAAGRPDPWADEDGAG